MIENFIQIGEPMEHRGIVIAPLFPTRDPVAEYVTLDEALAQGLRISEVDEAGTVPELVVENPLDKRVLLYDGEELVGAKQNRILNVSVLVEAKSALRIPVSCVEQGRWSRVSRSFLPGSHVSHAQLRRRKLEAQAAQPLARGVAQSEVWDAVHEKATRMSRPLADRRELRPLPGATSAICERSRTPSRRSRASAAPCSGSAPISASTSFRAPMRSRSCGRSSGPGTCSTRSSVSTGSRRRTASSRAS